MTSGEAGERYGRKGAVTGWEFFNMTLCMLHILYSLYTYMYKYIDLKEILIISSSIPKEQLTRAAVSGLVGPKRCQQIHAKPSTGTVKISTLYGFHVGLGEGRIKYLHRSTKDAN